LAIIGIVRSEWSGTTGGPGLSQHAVMGAAGGDWNPNGAQAAVNAVRAFWASMASSLPDEVRIQVSPVVDTYERENGDLFSSHVAGTPVGVVAGTSTAGYAGGAGTKITWNTGQIRNGRRVRGSTFIVPLSGALFTANGTLGTVTVTQLNTSAANLISALSSAATPLAVWSRPRTTPELRVGFATEVVSGSVSSKSAILRGRRD
jgi:hypothetical protein